jgi:hypothetical protein
MKTNAAEGQGVGLERGGRENVEDRRLRRLARGTRGRRSCLARLARAMARHEAGRNE